MTTTQIQTLPFVINGIVLNNNNNHNNHCPRCNSKFLRVIADKNAVRVTCTICYWEEFYIRIKKNGEGLI